MANVRLRYRHGDYLWLLIHWHFYRNFDWHIHRLFNQYRLCHCYCFRFF